MSSADVMEGGKWSVSVYGREAKTKPVVKVTDVSAVQIPLTSGNATIFSEQNGEIQLEQKFEEVIAQIKFRPKNGLTYRVKAGQVRSFQLEFSSGTHINKLESTGSGVVWGLGAEWNVFPGSIVSPAMTLDGSWTQTLVKLDKFESPDVLAATNEKFEQDEVQLALNVSKRWKQAEPFGGLKINRVVSRLYDDGTKESLRGFHDGWAPFVGIQWEFYEAESLVVEASFADDKSLNAGLNVRF